MRRKAVTIWMKVRSRDRKLEIIVLVCFKARSGISQKARKYSGPCLKLKAENGFNNERSRFGAKGHDGL